jgi:beta-lysine 5,6-aminomutase alpha subunit
MRLQLDPAKVIRARELAAIAGQPVVEMAAAHTTVSIERAVLRMAGLEGADAEGIPWVNRLADCVSEQVGLAHGVALPVWDALAAQRRAGIGADAPLLTLAQRAAAGSVQFRGLLPARMRQRR